MAIVAKLHSLQEIFKKTQELESLSIYLNNALKPNHLIRNRILDMKVGAENKFYLEAGMFCIEQAYKLKSLENAFYETHIDYIDFQLCIQGIEFFEIGDKNDFSIKSPYIQERDLIVYDKSLKTSKIRLEEGMLAIFFDYDVHSGGLAYEGMNGEVFKTVVKVPKKLIKFRL